MKNKEFFDALAEVVESKGIDEASLIESIEIALSNGYKRLKGDAFDVKLKLNKEKHYEFTYCFFLIYILFSFIFDYK